MIEVCPPWHNAPTRVDGLTETGWDKPILMETPIQSCCALIPSPPALPCLAAHYFASLGHAWLGIAWLALNACARREKEREREGELSHVTTSWLQCDALRFLALPSKARRGNQTSSHCRAMPCYLENAPTEPTSWKEALSKSQPFLHMPTMHS